MSDFSGMATVYGVLCNDGRVINSGAFDHQNGQIVPLVWRHNHGKITNVIGHGTLTTSESPPGIRVTGTFNNSKEGRQAKQLVDSKDVTNLSIWANEIREHAVLGEEATRRMVEHGMIREVSLVLAGANPGAYIDDYLRHSNDPLDIEGFVFDGIIVHTDETIVTEDDKPEDAVVEEQTEETEEAVEPVEPEEGTVAQETPDPELAEEAPTPEAEEETVEHADEDATLADILVDLNEDQRRLFDIVMHSANGQEIEPAPAVGANGVTVEEVFNTLTEEQKTTLYFLAGNISEEEEPIQQGDQVMTRNIFENEVPGTEDNVLSHADVQNVLLAAAERRTGTMREWFERAELNIAHSITDVDNLFPDAQSVSPGGPEFLARPMEWVESVLNATQTRPFSRIKSWYADLTPDAARAKGYVTGAEKAEEVVAVLKRTTTPQTIYKKQKLDRDDVLDITDFDVVVWLKSEMRLMLREELARAILVSDGRSGASADKIVETNVRPILFDSDVFTHKFYYNDVGNEGPISAMTDTELLDLIDQIALAMENYRGTGLPTFYAAPEALRRFMVIRDADGRRVHQTMEALAAALGVSRVVEIPVLASMQSTDVVNPTGIPAGTYDIDHLGIIVNLRDYVIGMDRGGQTSFFDDFDLDYNKYIYLYETRLSGALVHPKSAIAVNVINAKTA